MVGNGEGLRIKTGSIFLKLPNKNIHLKNVLHIPNIIKNLLSIAKLTIDNKVIVEFSYNCAFVKDQVRWSLQHPSTYFMVFTYVSSFLDNFQYSSASCFNAYLTINNL